MSFSIESFKSSFIGGGDRSSKFEVRLTIPGLVSGDAAAQEKFTMTCMAASIPPMVLGVVNVPYFGRDIKVAGDRVYPDWQVTIMNDEDQLVRRTLEQWSHRINAAQRNTTVAPVTSNPATYKTDADVYKYGKDGQLLRVYRLIGCWPSVISQIDLNWAEKDRIVEFGVTFAYDYWLNDTDILAGDGASFF